MSSVDLGCLEIARKDSRHLVRRILDSSLVRRIWGCLCSVDTGANEYTHDQVSGHTHTQRQIYMRASGRAGGRGALACLCDFEQKDEGATCVLLETETDARVRALQRPRSSAAVAVSHQQYGRTSP